MKQEVKKHSRKKKGGKRKVVKVSSYTREVPKITPTREPDIAFWFDEEDETMYIVEVKEGLLHIQLLQASFDLLAKTLSANDQTLVGEYTKEGG
jgi:hypothetical protein